MAVSNPTGFKAFHTSGDVLLYRRVALNSDGTVSHAGAGVKGIGTVHAVRDGLATVQLWNQGTHILTVGTGGMSAGSTAYAAADGTVAPTAVTPIVCATAVESGSQGDEIEFVPA